MSDFDKEAERERLRKKYEEDREDRATTERMSELLLKGATMTNKHCDACGDPIFRYQGQEFCPTCQAEAQEAQAGQAQEEATQAQAETAQTQAETGQSSPTPQERVPQSGIEAETGAADTAETSDTGNTSTSNERQSVPESINRSAQAGTSDLADARASLASSITSLAQRAEAAEDPRQAKEYLEAAREAAETLSALPR